MGSAAAEAVSAATVAGGAGLLTAWGTATVASGAPAAGAPSVLPKPLINTPTPMATIASAKAPTTASVLAGGLGLGAGVWVMGAPVCPARAGVRAGDGVVAAN